MKRSSLKILLFAALPATLFDLVVVAKQQSRRPRYDMTTYNSGYVDDYFNVYATFTCKANPPTGWSKINPENALRLRSAILVDSDHQKGPVQVLASSSQAWDGKPIPMSFQSNFNLKPTKRFNLSRGGLFILKLRVPDPANAKTASLWEDEVVIPLPAMRGREQFQPWVEAG